MIELLAILCDFLFPILYTILSSFIAINISATLSIQYVHIVLYCRCIVDMATIITWKIASIVQIVHIVQIALGSNKLLQLLGIAAISNNICDNCVQCHKICKSIAWNCREIASNFVHEIEMLLHCCPAAAACWLLLPPRTLLTLHKVFSLTRLSVPWISAC